MCVAIVHGHAASQSMPLPSSPSNRTFGRGTSKSWHGCHAKFKKRDSDRTVRVRAEPAQKQILIDRINLVQHGDPVCDERLDPLRVVLARI